MVTVAFGEPAHGWLPVTFRADTFQLELDASAVPANPLESLCEVLAVVPGGGSTRVLWYLEHAECWFDFENQAGEIALTITEKPGRAQPATRLLQLKDTLSGLLTPFYKALQAFTARNYSETHWPKLDKNRVAQLGEALRKQC